ncbi:magnesium and cobalt transport protein CorA [Nocardia alba]|uniref:Magnesium transporter n=1 Tax=Nocardia alba TaxID=225051 RepID=A0A4R1FP45_9NOCA|nr:magnesium and cobalt transport protein CorA [Nocardia alba]TCJ96323.1 magnesium transporter [Nocardia alba]
MVAGAQLRSRRRRVVAVVPKPTVPTTRAIVDCAAYVDGARLPDRPTPASAIAEIRTRGRGFVWIGLFEPDKHQMGEIADVFGLHPLAVEDAVNAHQRPKLERYDTTLVTAMRTVAYVEHDMHIVSEIVQTGEIMVFTGPDFVVAVRHGEHTGLTRVRHRLEADPDRLALGPGAVLHAITDHVVESYHDVTSAVEYDVESMEEELFTPRTTIPIEAIYQLKREIVELRRAVRPLAGPLQTLASPQTTLPKEVRRYLRDVADHHSGIAERINDLDETLTTLVGAAVAKIAVQQSTDMRKISAFVAILAVPTMIAGIYGMNFDYMPELKQAWGYPAVLATMATTCTTLIVVFRRINWL